MNCTYEKLSPTFSQELWELLDEAETLGIDPKVLEALFIAPLISNHIAEAETVAGKRLEHRGGNKQPVRHGQETTFVGSPQGLSHRYC